MKRHVIEAMCGVMVFGAAASGQLGDDPLIPFDPSAICDALRDEYLQGWCDERVSVTVRRAGGGERSDSFTVRVRGAGRIEFQLGDLLVWTDERAVYGVHRGDESVYFETPIQADDAALDVIRREFAPIPSPQLELVLGDGRGCPEAMAYVPALAWTTCQVNAEARPAHATLSGVGEGGVGGGTRVEWFADLEPVRLRRFELELDDSQTRIIGEVARIDGGRLEPGAAAGRLGANLEGRVRVSTVGELGPVSRVLRVGDVVPPFFVNPVDEATPGVASSLVPIDGACVIVMFKQWSKDPAIGLASALEATERFEEYRVIPLAVYDPEDEDTAPGIGVREWIDGIVPKVAPLDLYYTASAQRTIERVDTRADTVVLVLDSRGVVRFTERIDNIFTHAEPELLTSRILASLISR